MGIMQRLRGEGNPDGSQRQRDRIITFKRVFGTPEGHEALFELMNRYHILEAHDGDPFAEGQRSVILFILQQTHVNLQEFDKLLKGGVG